MLHNKPLIGLSAIWLLLDLIFFALCGWSLSITRDSRQIPYMLLLRFRGLIFPIATVLVIGWCVLFVALILVSLNRTSSTTARIVISSAPLLFLSCICWGSSAVFIGDSYWELDSAQFDRRIFHLGMRQNWEGAFNYAVCECDSPGGLCNCKYIYWTKTFWGEAYATPPRLVVDSTARELRVQLDNEIMYVYGESSYCHEPRGMYGFCSSLNK